MNSEVSIQVMDQAGCVKELQVEVVAETVQNRVDEIYNRILKTAKVPGFRKGKMPIHLVRQKFKNQVREEILQGTIPEFFRQALTEKGIEPISRPEVTSFFFEEGAPLKFIARIEVRPSFELKEYKGLKLKKDKIQVTPEDLEKELSNIRESAAVLVPIADREARLNDEVIIDFEGKINGEAFKGNQGKGISVRIGKGRLLKEFEDALIGVTVGLHKSFSVVFPDTAGYQEVAGTKAEFNVVVHEIKEVRLPELTDEFVKENFQIESVDKLKEAIEKEIQHARSVDQRAKLIHQITHHFLSEYQFEIPESLTSAEYRRLWNEQLQHFKSNQIDFVKLPQDKQDELVRHLKDQSVENVKMAFIIEKISEAEKIICEEKDFHNYVETLAHNAHQSPQAMEAYIQKNSAQAKIQEWIQYEKTLDFLISVADIEIIEK